MDVQLGYRYSLILKVIFLKWLECNCNPHVQCLSSFGVQTEKKQMAVSCLNLKYDVWTLFQFIV